MKATERDIKQIAYLHKKLGIDSDYAYSRVLVAFSEASELVKIENDLDPRCLYLAPPAAKLWQKMKAAALKDEIDLQIYSGFRSYEYQRNLIAERVLNGENIESVLSYLAAPGYSEHHTGLAVDLTTSGCSAGCEEFEHTPAFKWLETHASKFQFHLSYPRNNPWGFVYEPWHWCLC